MSDILVMTFLCAVFLATNKMSGDIGYARGRRSAFEDIQRSHLEDDEALNRRASE